MTNRNEATKPENRTDPAGRLHVLVMCAIRDFFHPLLWLTCRVKGHEFAPARQYLLPARQCSRCGLHQVKLPDAGCSKPGWTKSNDAST